MKKALLALLAIILCFSLFACDPNEEPDDNEGDQSQTDDKLDLKDPFDTPFADIELG